MEKEVVEVATKAEEAEEVEGVKAEVELPEYTVALELLLNTREYAVLKDSMSFTMVKRHQSIK